MEIVMADAVKIDFAKMDGLVPGIVQDAKTGEMLMLGFPERNELCEDAGDRICDVLEQDAEQALDEGRDERESAAGDRGFD